jgi:CRISPR-associated protein Cas5d
MASGTSQLEVKVWGDYACFTRPEMKVERVSYPVMTPSAARGALEAIFWKPQVEWLVEEVVVLKPIAFASILRNEVNSRQTERTAAGWAARGTGGYDAASDRAQRHSLVLRDVAYVIRGQLILKADVAEDIAKYRDQFRRRVRNGQCFATPFLGCREFSASFGEPGDGEAPVPINEALGPMLLDIAYDSDGSGRGKPRFFEAALAEGVLHVPNRFAEVA